MNLRSHTTYSGVDIIHTHAEAVTESKNNLCPSLGDKQRRNLSYATEALKLWVEEIPDVYVSGNLFIRYEEDGAEKRIAPDIFVVFGTSKEDRVSYTVWEEDGKVPDFVLEITSKGTVTKDHNQNPLIYRDLNVLPKCSKRWGLILMKFK